MRVLLSAEICRGSTRPWSAPTFRANDATHAKKLARKCLARVRARRRQSPRPRLRETGDAQVLSSDRRSPGGETAPCGHIRPVQVAGVCKTPYRIHAGGSGGCVAEHVPTMPIPGPDYHRKPNAAEIGAKEGESNFRVILNTIALFVSRICPHCVSDAAGLWPGQPESSRKPAALPCVPDRSMEFEPRTGAARASGCGRPLPTGSKRNIPRFGG